MAKPDRELLRILPRVLRARDFHLYLEGGKRITDLWLAGGKALLGHKPPRVLAELKNAGERGLFSPLPHPMERRFIKALAELFFGRSFRLYADEGALFRALEEAGFDGPPFYDPAFSAGAGKSLAAGKERVSLWRPFLEKPGDPVSEAGTGDNGDSDAGGRTGRDTGNETETGSDGDGDNGDSDAGGNGETARVLIPVLPCPLGPAVLVLDKTLDAFFPPGDLIPPVSLAPAARAVYDLAAAMKVPAPNRGCPRCARIEKVTAGCHWRRRGIYLTREPAVSEEEYETLFRRFLEGGFLIPPSQGEPAILPTFMPPGEESKLAELLRL